MYVAVQIGSPKNPALNPCVHIPRHGASDAIRPRLSRPSPASLR